MDEVDLRCIVDLQLEDIDRRKETSKSQEGVITDSDYAFDLYLAELKALSDCLKDRRMCLSIFRAVEQDASTIEVAETEERAATSDRELALKLSGKRVSKQVRFELSIGSKETRDGVATSSSSKVGKRPINSTSSGRSQCTACLDEHFYFDSLSAPCGHSYCRGCLAELFEAATVDESLFPPRCCRQEIPVKDVESLVEPALITKFTAKAVELRTINRTYCHRSGCSEFISPGQITGDRGCCPLCFAETCTICKGPVHSGADCPSDPNLHQILNVARENAWQRCFSCHRLVELEVGCNHITCRCGAQFCYVCGVRWKECSCAQWDENRLFNRARQIQQRGVGQGGQQQPDPVRAQNQVREIAQHLRDRHQCTHERWQYVRGPHDCEECYFSLPQYIFECRRCRLQACNRCRRNRL